MAGGVVARPRSGRAPSLRVRWIKLVFNLVITAYVRDLLLLSDERARLISSELTPTVTVETSETLVFSHRGP